MLIEQVINKALISRDPSLFKRLDFEDFVGYEDKYEFISNHLEKYETLPDENTFLTKFEVWELFPVDEADD